MPPKVMSLSELNARGNDEDNARQAPPNLFTGGINPQGGGSGQNVIDPRRFMENAQRDMGAVAYSEHERNARQAQAFTGRGYSLSGSAGGGPSVDVQAEDRTVRHKVTFWKGGFSVDDGEFRSATDPVNQRHLEYLTRGYAPAEWGWKSEDYIEVLDRTSEEYVKPPVVTRPFQGEGNRLGGASGVSGGRPAAQAIGSQTPGAVAVDESKPITQIQVRLHDGRRIVGRFNQTHTVGDVRRWVASATPGALFSLSTTMPRKVLSDDSATLKDADLINTALQQALL